MERRKLQIDYSQAIFFAEQLRPKGYDREIDEGMSSGLIRYATLDATKLSEKQTTSTLEKLVNEAKDFDMCKLVQVAGFNKDNKRYLIVSGESHISFARDARDMMLETIKKEVGKLPVEYVKDHITPPVAGEPYKPTNLGMYGSTGNPVLGIPQHPDAKKLRDEGKIR